MGLWKPICDLKSDNAQFNFCAQPAPAIAFAVLFGLTFCAHFLQMFTFRKKFAWVVTMAATWEFTSFVLRIPATKNQLKSSTGSSASLLVLLAPLWVNAFAYVVLGRMVHYYLPEKKIMGVRAIHMARTFVWLDITSFLVQATGGVLADDNSQSEVRLGLRIYTIGIGVQEAFIMCFLSLVFRFHWKMAHGYGIPERGEGWKKLVYTIYATLTLITVRIIFRICEFANLSATSPVATDESYFYAFDATPMWAALVLWNIVHPGSVLIGPESEYPKKVKLSRKEKKAMKRDKKARKQGARDETADLELEERQERKHRKHRKHHSHRSSAGEGLWPAASDAV